MPERGSYVVFEGSDGVGKTTQLEHLRHRLDAAGIEASFTREPGGSDVGREVRMILLSPDIKIASALTEVALFTADRIEHWHQVIAPALEAGKLVVSDRNWYSTLAYQTANKPELAETIKAVTELMLPPDYVKPDLALVLYLDEAERQRRRDDREAEGIADWFEMRDSTYFERVNKLYRQTTRQMGAVAINASASQEDVAEAIWQQVSKLVT